VVFDQSVQQVEIRFRPPSRAEVIADYQSALASAGDALRGEKVYERECMACHHRFTTYEEVERARLMVIKRDGRREEFSREKLLSGVQKACEKRPVSQEQIDHCAAMVVVAAVLGGWQLYQRSRVDWARSEALPEISRLLAQDKGLAAFDLAQQVAALIPDDPDFQQAWAEAGPKPLVQTDPEGAEVFAGAAERGEHAAAWTKAGREVIAVTDLGEVPESAVHIVVVNPNNPDGRITRRDVIAEAAVAT
jgi:hypothetical protein